MENSLEKLSMKDEQVKIYKERFNSLLKEYEQLNGGIEDRRVVEGAEKKFHDAMNQSWRGAKDITKDYEAQRDVIFSALKEGVAINKADTSEVGRDAKKTKNVFAIHGEVPPEAKKPLPWSRSLH